MDRAFQKPGQRFQALLQLLRTSETLWNASRVFFAQWEISSSQFNVLNLLMNSPDGLSQTELSRALIMHRSNVTGLVDRLEARKLISRKENLEDRRAYRVVLTVSGRRLVEKILPRFYEAAEEIWGEFPVAQTDQLSLALARLSLNAEQLAANLQKKK